MNYTTSKTTSSRKLAICQTSHLVAFPPIETHKRNTKHSSNNEQKANKKKKKIKK
jgi:hypothetical protein